jgi:hypothetical protein
VGQDLMQRGEVAVSATRAMLDAIKRHAGL